MIEQREDNRAKEDNFIIMSSQINFQCVGDLKYCKLG